MTKIHITLNKSIIGDSKLIDNAIQVLTNRYKLENINNLRAQRFGIVTSDVEKVNLSEMNEDSLIEAVTEDTVRSNNDI